MSLGDKGVDNHSLLTAVYRERSPTFVVGRRRTTNRFPSPRCASAIQIVGPLESMAETQPKLHSALPEVIGDGFPVFHANLMRLRSGGQRDGDS